MANRRLCRFDLGGSANRFPEKPYRQIKPKTRSTVVVLRDLRNVGAHAVLGELTKEEVPILDDLINALLEYIYSASHLIDRADAKLDEIRNRR